MMFSIKSLFPYIFQWAEFSEEKQLNFNGYLLFYQGESVIIDPPKLSENGLDELNIKLNTATGFPLKAILLTNMHHERSSQKLKELYSIPIYINEDDAKGLEVPPDKTFKNGDHLFCSLKSIQLKNQKSIGETAFYLESEKLLIVGDALIGKPEGKVSLLPNEKYEDPVQAKESLKILLKFDFEKLLVGDGESILTNGKSYVEKLLNT